MPVAYNYPPNNAYTIPDEVSLGRNITISHGNLVYKTRYQDRMVVPVESLIGKYSRILHSYIITKEYTDREFSPYYQRPKMLSMDLYGTPELWSWLLHINNCKSVANFIKPKVKIFTQNIGNAIEEILVIEHDDMKKNKRTVYPDE